VRSPEEDAPVTGEGARPAVVVAEDDEDIARILDEALRADGVADPVVVSNGALVIDAVISSGARVLLLDVQMPGASGIDVYDVVRNHPALRDIAVLFVTANPELARETLRGNAPREVIAKPFDIDALVGRVRELLRDEVAA
jgi:DNA-binding response OmpR family regulator